MANPYSGAVKASGLSCVKVIQFGYYSGKGQSTNIILSTSCIRTRNLEGALVKAFELQVSRPLFGGGQRHIKREL